MVHQIFCLVFAAVFALSAATEVSLSGTVKDESGKAIAGAVVSLVNGASLKDTTDAQGAFALTGNIAVGVAVPYAISVQEPSKLTSRGTSIQFVVNTSVSQADVALFSSSGRRVAFLQLGKLTAGRQNFSLPVMVPGFYVMKITLDRVTTTTKLMNTGTGFYISDHENRGEKFGSLGKSAAAAAVDTIVVTKSGFTTKEEPVASYIKTGIAIVMSATAVTVCPELKLPGISAISYSNKKHPDAFTFKYMNLPDKKVTTKAQWECRRQEILQMAQDYLYGHLPPKCDVVGTVSGGKITAKCSYNGKSVDVSVSASGSGEILLINIGFGGAPTPEGARTASASGATFLSNAKSLYGSTDMGIVMASAWGVGRIIDALEQNPDCGISAKKVMVTGCSTNGKQAMGAGVFEPRVALCVPVESGCAGTCSWRVSSEYGHGNSNTDCQDMTHLETNWTGTMTDNTWERGNPKIDKLPFDQGELMALRAPGGFLQIDNGKEQYKWLCNRGNTAAAQSCHWIYKALGVEDNFGFVQPTPGHGHCSWAKSITPDATKFYDKFLNGKTDVNTHVFTYNPESMETDKWFDFGKGEDQWDTTLVLE